MMPNGWKESRLGDLFGKRSSPGLSGLPTVSVTLDRGLVLRENLDRKMETTLEPHQHLLVKSGDIAYNMMRMWQGALGLADFDCMVSPAYVVCEPKDKNVNSKFFYYLFKSPALIKKFKNSSRGLTEDRLRLYYDDFGEIRVKLPSSIQEQEKIAKILSTWDEAIEKLGQLEIQIAKTIQFFSLKAFENSGKRKIKISDALEFLRDGTHGTHANMDSGIPLLSAKDIGADGNITMNAPRLISEEEYRKIQSKYEINAGDVLLTIVGTIGRVAIVPEGLGRFSVQRSVAILRPSTRYRSDYLYYYLRSDLIQKRLKKSANASAQAGIYLGELAKLEIEELDIKEQEQVIKKLKVLDRRLYLTTAIRLNLQNQKQGLMQQLLTGKKRVKV